MKLVCTLFLFLVCNEVVSQSKAVFDSLHQVFSPNKKSIYLVCRGTQSKKFIVGDKFNLCDTNSTHVGIAFSLKNELLIYSVEDVTSQKSALQAHSIKSFVYPHDIFYLSIWQAKVNRSELKRLRKLCNDYARRQLFFDYLFQLGENDTLYCSEFCAMMLNKSYLKDLKFQPTIRGIFDSFYEIILGRKYLFYYPVDFFQVNGLFTKIVEIKIE